MVTTAWSEQNKDDLPLRQLSPHYTLITRRRGCGSVFIFYGSGSGSTAWCWRPIRILIQIRIQGFNNQKLKKNYSWKFFFIFFWSKTAIYLSLSLHKVCPSYKRSLQFSKEAIQHFKTWTFTNYCLLLWVIFALLDPDPDPDSEYGSGSGSTDPIKYGSNTDPDPQPCTPRHSIPFGATTVLLPVSHFTVTSASFKNPPAHPRSQYYE